MAGGRIRQNLSWINSGMTTTISVILNLIQNQLDPVRQRADWYLIFDLVSILNFVFNLENIF